MNGYTKKQIELVERINETADLLDEEKIGLKLPHRIVIVKTMIKTLYLKWDLS